MSEEQSGQVPSEPTVPSTPPAARKETVTVTAKEDCSLLVDGQSVTLAAGDTVELTPEAAKEYAHLGLVEIKGGGIAGSADPSGGVPRRR